MAEIASAFVTIAPSAKGFGSKLSSEVGSGVRGAGSSLGKTFGKLFVLGAGVIAAAGIGNFLKGSIDEAREAQKVGAQTNAVLKSTGGVAGITADQVGKMSTRLSNFSGIDDEAIASGENLLLTFTNIRNEVGGKFVGTFDTATQAALDMGVALGTDTRSAALQLGKALNDPAKGYAKLQRSGVSFTDTQIKQIKNFQKTGQTAKAQGIILKEVQKEFGGSAAAQATAGDKARVAWGNLKETIGTALLPVLDRLENFFTAKIAPAITTFVGQLKTGEGAGGRVAAMFATVAGAIGTFVGQIKSGTGPGGVLAKVMGTVASALGTLFAFIANNKTVVAAFVGTIYAIVVATAAWNAVLALNPISLVVIAIAALVAGLVYAYKHSKTFAAIVDASFSAIKKVISAVIGFVVPFVKKHWQLLVTIIGGPLAFIVIQVIKHFDTIKRVVGVAVDFVVGQAKQFAKFASLVVGHVAKVVKFFKELPGKIKGFLTGLPGQLKTIGGQIIQGLVDGISAAAHKVADVVQGIINKIPKKIRSIMGIASPSKVTYALGGFIGDGLAAGIAAKETKVGQAVDKLGKKVKEKVAKLRDTLSGLKDDFASLVDPIASNFTQNLFDFDTASAFTANLASVKGTLNTLIDNFKKLKGEGLSPGFLYQLFQSGGPGLINSLAALDSAGANSAAALFGDVSSLSQQLGTSVAGATDGGAAISARIDKTNALLEKLTKHVDKAADRTGDVVNGAAANGHRRGT